MKINQDLIFKWTLRIKYIYIFILGSLIASLGTSSILGYEKIFETKSEANFYLSLIAIIIGLVLIVIGFYRMTDIENYIRKHKL